MNPSFLGKLPNNLKVSLCLLVKSLRRFNRPNPPEASGAPICIQDSYSVMAEHKDQGHNLPPFVFLRVKRSSQTIGHFKHLPPRGSIGYLGWEGPSHWRAELQTADTNRQQPALRINQQPPVVFSAAQLSGWAVWPAQRHCSGQSKTECVWREMWVRDYLVGYGSSYKNKHKAIFMFLKERKD